jgi:hypothetical protein
MKVKSTEFLKGPAVVQTGFSSAIRDGSVKLSGFDKLTPDQKTTIKKLIGSTWNEATMCEDGRTREGIDLTPFGKDAVRLGELLKKTRDDLNKVLRAHTPKTDVKAYSYLHHG